MAIHKDARAVASKVQYEYDMFRWAGDEVVRWVRVYSPIAIGEGKDIIVNSIDDRDDRWIAYAGSSGIGYPGANAMLECFLIHTRCLADFFCKKRTKDDVIAGDYFSDTEEWKRVDLTPYLKANMPRLNKALAHLSYERLDFERNKKWNVSQIRKDIESMWDKFLGKLPASRRKWFESTIDRDAVS